MDPVLEKAWKKGGEMTWDESKHPRHPAGTSEGGQFAEKVVTSAREAAGVPESRYPESDPTYEDKLHNTIEDFRVHLYMNNNDKWPDYEKAVVVDEDMEVLFSNIGSKMSVIFTDEQVEQMEGKWLLHNHPNSSFFSRNDFLFLIDSKLEGIVAMTEGGYYKAWMDEGLSDEKRQDLLFKIGVVWDKWNESIFSDHYKAVIDGKMTAEKADDLHQVKMFEALKGNSFIDKYMDITFHEWTREYWWMEGSE